MKQESFRPGEEKGQSAPDRRVLRYGLRTLLVLFCLTAIGINYTRHRINQTKSLKVLQACGAEFVYAHEMDEDFDFLADPWDRSVEDSSLRKLARYCLGSAIVDRVACVRMIEKSNFAPIRPLNQELKPHQTDAWVALRTLNEIRPLRAVAVEINSTDQMEILSGFDKLKYLQVISYSRENMGVLDRLPELESLEFATRSSDIAWIGNCKKVTTLNIRKVLPAPRLTVDIGFLSNMPQLKSLELRALELRNLESISELSNLQQLGLVHTDVTSAHSFCNLRLESLTLSNSPISNTNGLAEISTLEVLDLTDTALFREQITTLKDTLKIAGSACQVKGSGVTQDAVPKTESANALN